MKKLFTIIAAATMFVACNSKSDLDTKKDVVLTDTTSMYKSNASTDVSNATVPKQDAPPAVAPTRTIIRERTIYVNRAPRASRQVYHEATPVDPVVNTVPQSQPAMGSGTGTSNGNSGVGSSTAGSGTSIPGTISEKKKGWSNAAKDAAIGGVGGAVVGAVISKRKGTGAIIGGILGAAGGYILGHKKDKSENSFPKYVSY